MNLQTSLWHASIYNCFCTVDFSSDNKILTQLISIEQQLDKLYVNTESEILEGGEEVRFLATVSDLADRELVITISWAKQVPGNGHENFPRVIWKKVLHNLMQILNTCTLTLVLMLYRMKIFSRQKWVHLEEASLVNHFTGFCTLSLSDQMNLLQHSWLEILCLNLVFRSCPYNGYLKFAEDLQLSVDECKLCHCSPELDGISRKLAKKFTDMEVTKEEYLLLKAMTLCNIGTVLFMTLIC